MNKVQLNRSGYRLSDAQALHQLYNATAQAIGAMNPADPVVLRRLRVMGSWLQETANACFNSDPEADAIAICDNFWARRAAGERGTDDA